MKTEGEAFVMILGLVVWGFALGMVLVGMVWA